MGVRLALGLSQPADDASLRPLPDQTNTSPLPEPAVGLGLQFYDARFHDVVHAFRMPGYPVFLAALGADVGWRASAQAAVDTSTVLEVYLWRSPAEGPGPWGRRLARDGGGLVAVNPTSSTFRADS